MTDPHNLYFWQMAGHREAPGSDRIRIEDATRPDFGQLVAIGSVVRTSYSSLTYRVSDVRKHEPFPGVFYWTVIGQDIIDGVAVKGPGKNILNEYVAEYQGGVPRFLKLFKNNADELFIESAVAFVAARNGQLSLF